MASHRERIAEIEALFRAGNDRMLVWPETQRQLERGEALPFFCECGRRSCRAHIRLTGHQYEAIRADTQRFVLAPGHEFPDTEDVVERHDEYVVVLKHDDVRDLVERLNLRSESDSES